MTDQELRNREENLHFDWITNLFEWLNQGHTSPEIIIEPFISQLHKKREEERWDIERKLTKSLILKSFENTVIKVNQLLVIKEYHNSFRLGRVLKSETSNFNLVEVKKDLTRGKRPINYVNIENIYAVIDYNELDRKTDKNLILRNIQNQESFNGLKYIRPSNLW